MSSEQTDPIAAAPFSPGVRLAIADAVAGRAEAQGIVKHYAIVALSIGLLPFPALDGVALVNLQMNLIGRLADQYGVAFNNVYRSMAASLITGALPVLVTGLGLSMLKVVPVFGSLSGAGTLSTLAAAMTYANGQVLIEHFEAGGTLDNLSPAVFRRRLRAQLSSGQRFVNAPRGMPWHAQVA
ncbi:MAG: DUF697 domain-containing protein [Thiohalocapsa sp. PB-PSB1]|jgi:uncharacterized protein (DUF697 family)|nr:MAG: hypothetical protein N838_17215 [Thiohalocapsa sp. PB-PSB1]QQO52229.1 MAG: DUF697 domain-containing protein [Thiohalocapsa sp. PB-PSB1]HCS92535.1 DUF697 domain-containing protein [Chromatiaceae bacterium]